LWNYSAPERFSANRARCEYLDSSRNIRFRENERFARELDDAFIRAATGGWRQMLSGDLRDIGTDDCEISGIEFEYVGASARRESLSASLMWIWSKSS